MKRRNSYSPQKAKSHLIYSRHDVLHLYGICRNTLPNWIKRGLVVAGRSKQRYFRGSDLNAFHRACAEERTRRCATNEVHCVACKKIHTLQGLPSRIELIDSKLIRQHVTCPERGKITCKVMKLIDLHEIQIRSEPNPERKQQAIQ